MAKQKKTASVVADKPRYDVALSFASEQRGYVEQVAEALKAAGVLVFYDAYEKANLWGKDLYSHLTDIYSKASRYCLMFISEDYARKVWPNVERRAAQERALRELHREYILPLRFDDTELPGLPATIAYIDASQTGPLEIAEIVFAKLGRAGRANHLPDDLSEFVAYVAAEIREELGTVDFSEVFPDEDPAALARTVYDILTLTDLAEREFIFQLVSHACPVELPENVHQRVDLMKRVAHISIDDISRMGDRLDTLGFDVTVYEDESHGWSESQKHQGRKYEVVRLELHSRSLENDNVTFILAAMIGMIGIHYCEDHALAAFKRLDFSALQLAS